MIENVKENLKKIDKKLAAVFLCFSLMFITSVSFADAKPYMKSDNSFISITGNVASVVSAKGRGFTLDFGDGLIAVEVDDFDLDDDSAGILPGERVTVYGRIDDDLFEMRSIEASSVYVHDRSTYYFASSLDEDGSAYIYSYFPDHPKDGSWVSVAGTVKDVDSDGKQFVVDTGIRKIDVETHALAYNPLDKVGFQKIKKGDLVSVTGILDENFMSKDDIVADSVITVTVNKDKIEKKG